MADEAADPVAWLRAQVEADLARWRGLEAAYLPDIEREGEVLWFQAREHAAQFAAMLAVIDSCEEAMSRGESPEEGGWHDGRDPDERERDEALAGFADDILALFADGYRHREGWAGHWACPGCGKAIREVPLGHSWAISVQDGTWTCSDLQGGPVSPQEFMAAALVARADREIVARATGGGGIRSGEILPAFEND